MVGVAGRREAHAVPTARASVDGARDLARVLAGIDPPLHPPRFGPEVVERPELRDRLRSSGARVALVLAPAGYGKTTLVAQWAALDDRPTSWLSLRESDNDPPALLGHALFALEPAGWVEAKHFETIALSGADLATVVLPRFGALVADSPPTLWVFDDVHVLRADGARLVLRVVLEHLAEGSTLVLVGREAPDLPIARRRAGRGVLDVGPEDLTMSDREAAALLKATGVKLGAGDVDAIVSRTEGWPAGLYLGSLATRDGADVSQGSAGSRAIEEYLLDEVLRAATPDEATFLTRSAIFEQIPPTACDDVLVCSDSAIRLDQFEHSNRFVRAVGASRAEYRYHQLFRDLLLGELRRREPLAEAQLHARASAWFEAKHDIDRAITHAHAADDRERVAQLVWEHVAEYIGTGRTATVQRWLDAFSAAEVAQRAPLALSAAWVAFTDGDTIEMDRWATILHTHDVDTTLPDGTSFRGALALVDALVATHGLRRSLADAELAYELHGPGTPYRALAGLVAGIASRLLGDTERARTWCSEALQLGVALPPVQAQAAAQLARLDADAGAWGDALRHLDTALAVVAQFGFEERTPMCQVYATAGHVHAHEGRGDAKDLLKHALWLVGSLRGVARFVVLDVRIVLARSLALVGELELARVVAHETADLLDTYPDAGELPAMLDEARARIDAADLPLGVSASPLTPAELRVLRYLPTHLSFAEIADEVYVSRNTVKTQAIAVYRKLGVTSRAAAVERARAAGLLDP
ncbi:MAG: LuxR C-terminal-related transcriptional regulator [Acidimicrobiia bacterium]